MLLPYLIYNLSDRGDEFSAAEHGNASACEMRSVQARSRMRLSHTSLSRNEFRPQSEHGVGAASSGLLLGYGFESTEER